MTPLDSTSPLTPPAFPVPRQVVLAVRAVLGVAGIHLLALGLLAVHRSTVVAAVRDSNPAWSASRSSQVGGRLWLSAIVTHVVLAAILIARGRRLRRPGPGGRRIVTALLVLQLLSRASLPVQLQLLPGFEGWVLAVQGVSLVLEVAALWLLWRPLPSRAHFAGRLTATGRRYGRRQMLSAES